MDANRFASNTWAQLQGYEYTSNPSEVKIAYLLAILFVNGMQRSSFRS
jgi:hypothetical protein